MGKIVIKLPDSFYDSLVTLAERAEQAARSAELSLEMSSKLVGQGGTAYTTLSEEIKQLRELTDDIRDRLHTLGNAINGKLGAYEVEKFIRQVVDERLEHHSLI